MTLEDFKSYYNKFGKCPNMLSKPKHILNETELISKYNSYLNSEDKKKIALDRYKEKASFKEVSIDEKWEEVKFLVNKRDNRRCRLLPLLSNEEYTTLKSNSLISLLNTNDCAHIIGRGEAPSLVYDIENILLLNRVCHSRLDHFLDPITGKSITKEVQLKWWFRIVGKEYYNKLLIKNKGEFING